MGFKPSPYLTTREICRIKPFLLGDKSSVNNVFCWDKVVLNLPGSTNYTPARPRVFRVREDGDTMAADLFIYIDDVRNTAPSAMECWAGAHQVCGRLAWLGIQDAARKKNFATQTPRAWAGSIVHTDGDCVTVLVSEEKWAKTKMWIDWVLERMESEEGLEHKELEKCRGFLIYVSRTYLSFKPYLRGLHKTIDSWRPLRDEDGWKLMYEIMQAKENGEWFELNNREPKKFVKPVKRLKNDFLTLKKFTQSPAPPKVVKRRKGIGTAFYGFGDASGKGFGYALEINGRVHAEYGQWEATIEEMHSNYKELRNLVNAVIAAYERNALNDCELYVFTDNFVAEAAYYNGGSNRSKELDELVFILWELQMKGNFSLFIYHVAGTRMIKSGIDGLSRGDKAEGISLGIPLGAFIPIHLSPLERSSSVQNWIDSWWDIESFGKLHKLSPEEWFTHTMTKGSWLWDVAPTAGEAAVELLCDHVHGRPENVHIFCIPRLCTCHWRKQLGKVCDVVLTIEAKHSFWGAEMHEPLLLGIYLPLLPPLFKYRPWRFKYTKHVGALELEVRRMQTSNVSVEWNCLRKLLHQAGTIRTMSDELARKVLQEED